MRVVSLILLAGLLSGCFLTEPDGPALDDETFVAVKAELHLLQTRFELDEEELAAEARDSVFAYFEISPESYEETVEFYSQRPREYHRLYRQVVDLLREKEAERLQDSVLQ